MREQERSAVIHSILPRKTKFTRKIAGNRTEEQVITANIDFVFVMTSLNRDFNLRRLERYLTIAWNSGANPVIILSKADLCPDAGAKVIEVEKVSAGVPVHAISVWNGTGLNALSSYFQEGQTIAFVGSSGVGKSTLINHLAGKELMSIREIREHDDRGKHATTHRQLILLPQGGLIVDTPGMRELQLWDSNPADSPFTDVQYFARQCYFSDCSHRHEPGCAVRKALEEGELDSDRFLSYEKLQKELRYVAVRQDAVAKQNQRKKWKKLTRMAKDRSRWKRM
jgi:ribosome biogenesis GTPase